MASFKSLIFVVSFSIASPAAESQIAEQVTKSAENSGVTSTTAMVTTTTGEIGTKTIAITTTEVVGMIITTTTN